MLEKLITLFLLREVTSMIRFGTYFKGIGTAGSVIYIDDINSNPNVSIGNISHQAPRFSNSDW